MKKNLNLTLVIIWLFCFKTYSQSESKLFQGNNYYKIDNMWKQYNALDAKYYNIATDIITLKFKQNITSTQITEFIQTNNLILLNKAITGWYDFKFLQSENVFVLSENLKSSNLVEKLEIPVEVIYNDVGIPNDADYNLQWYLNKIDAQGAWNISTGNPNVAVAVIDQGVEWTHLDLGLGADNYQNILLNNNEDVWTNPNDPTTGNGIDDDGNGYIDDWKGWAFEDNNNNSNSGNPWAWHGTFISGIIAAKTNNNIGISGIAGGWNNSGVKILPIFLGLNRVSSSYIDNAILYAVQRGVKVIQLSLSTSSSVSINDAIDYAYNHGVTIVCSAGNDSSGLGINYPANNPHVIGVGASDENDLKATFSNYGFNSLITAPGVNLYSLYPDNSYTTNLGTSFAAPMVSGIIALMYSVNGGCLNPDKIKEILKNTAQKVGGYDYNWDPTRPGHSKEMGYGRVNAYEAVQAALQMTSLDLYIKDSPNDNGNEPNNLTQFMWNSEDIWVRNIEDNGTEHLNPEYSPTVPNYVYVRIKNKSCYSVSFGAAKLKVYWAKAATSLSYPENWIYIPNAVPQMGGLIDTFNIPFMAPGAETIIPMQWYVPNPANYPMNTEPWHFCLLARIQSELDPMTVVETPNINFNVRQNNNIAWKNVTVVNDVLDRPIGANISGVVAVRNPFEEAHSFDLELVEDEIEKGKSIYNEAEVSINMDELLFNAWQKGGQLFKNLIPTKDERRKIVGNNNAFINNIILDAKETTTLNVMFNFLTKELTDKDKFKYHLVQRDSKTGEIIGGETYLIKKHNRPVFFANAGNDKDIFKNETITISAEQINEAAVYNWFDTDGNLIYQGKDLTISADVTKKYRLEVVATKDGFKDYAEIEIKVKNNMLNFITPNPSSDQIMVNYKIGQAQSAYLMIVDYYGNIGTSNNYLLDIDATQTTINISNYLSGFYSVALVCDGQIVDAKTLIKN